MNSYRTKLIRLAFLLLLGAGYSRCQAQVYSLAAYSGGTSYQTLCSFDIPVPPYHYKITERGRYEDKNGFTIINSGHETELGGVLCRYLDVECGSESFTVWLDREPTKAVRERMAEDAERESQLKANLDSGFFLVKTFVLSNRTDSLSDQDVLFSLEQHERFRDRGGIRAMGPESNVIRITASTNDMPTWENIIREFDRPHTN
jgi:hypothetical protein